MEDFQYPREGVTTVGIERVAHLWSEMSVAVYFVSVNGFPLFKEQDNKLCYYSCRIIEAIT